MFASLALYYYYYYYYYYYIEEQAFLCTMALGIMSPALVWYMIGLPARSSNHDARSPMS